VVLADFALARLDAQDHAADDVGRFDFNPFAAKLRQNLTQRGIAGQIDGEGLECLGDRVAGAVGHRGDTAAPQVLHDHALEQVVDVVDVELQIDSAVPLNFAAMLEEANPRVEHHHLLQRYLIQLLLRNRRLGGVLGQHGQGSQADQCR